jgi:hypothetical protein
MSDESVPRGRISRRWIVGNGIGRDVARQVANVVGAIFHVVAGLFLADGAFPGENITLIQPANYTFVIWAAIFLSLLTYTAYQERTRRLSERYRGSREDTGGIVRVSSELPQTEP